MANKKYQVLIVMLISVIQMYGQSIGLSEQTELKKIIPLSPDAAAIVKYGEIPVGHFTGIPNVEVPLYVAQSGDLQLPLSLTYHAGGNKVEDIASWIGLGWSLSNIPVISRSVRSVEDESGLGYFSLYQGKTIKEIYNDRNSGTTGLNFYNDFMEEVRNGLVDTEPDVFSYTLPNRSGKFYFNQSTQKFYTIPSSNIKIDRIDNGFKFTDDNGNQYYFTIQEISTQNLNSTTNSWWINKIINANKTDSIVFEYGTQTEYFTTINSVSKSIYVSGDLSCIFPSFHSNSISSQILSIKPDRIKFRSGYIKFVPKTSMRLDLSGGYALDRIEIYSNEDILQKKFQLQQIYHSNNLSSSPDNYRLILDRIWEESASGVKLPPHLFTYNLSIVVPNRLSTGQDYWGYFNGAQSNSDLVPSIFYNNRKLTGAIRRVDTSFTQFSILTQIKYPTGGTSEFEYQNNWVNEPSLPIHTKDTSVLLSGNGTSQGNHGLYEKYFTIDIPPDPEINNKAGGTFLDVYISNLGCDISGGANLCANLSIVGLTNGYHSGSLINNINGLYIPNGNYKLVAEFYQDPAQYQNFAFGISWLKADSSYVNKRLAGGLRIKKTVNHDGYSHEKDVIKSYTYDDGSINKLSSGKVFGSPFFDFTEHYTYTKYSSPAILGENCVSCLVNLLKRSSYSNISAVSHSGSFVGYTQVNVDYGGNGQSGRTSYFFNHVYDQVMNTFPYAPALSLEQRRGHPLEIVDFKKEGNNFIPVKRTKNFYKSFVDIGNTSIQAASAFGLKVATKDIIDNQCGGLESINPEQVAYAYELPTDWVGLYKTEEKIYSQDDTLKFLVKTTEYEFDATYLQSNKIKNTNSKNARVLIQSKFPYELVLSGSAEVARQKLISQNRVSIPLQVIKSVDEVQHEYLETNYKEIAFNIILPDNIKHGYLSNTPEVAVSFSSYDTKGNLQEQQKRDGIAHSYIWDYNNNLAVAQAINANIGQIAYTSFEAEGAGNFSGINFQSVVTGSAITGSKFYQGDFYITRGSLASGTIYIVSYWTSSQNAHVVSGTQGTPKLLQTISKNGTSWKLYEHRVTGINTLVISGNGTIDELRLYPENALMTTYTYNPLIGITSQTDANNRTTFYDYDEFGRLQLIKDHDGYILKTYQYQFQQAQ